MSTKKKIIGFLLTIVWTWLSYLVISNPASRTVGACLFIPILIILLLYLVLGAETLVSFFMPKPKTQKYNQAEEKVLLEKEIKEFFENYNKRNSELEFDYEKLLKHKVTALELLEFENTPRSKQIFKVAVKPNIEKEDILPEGFDVVRSSLNYREAFLVYPKKWTLEELIEASGVTGVNYSVTNEQILKRLKEWDVKFGIEKILDLNFDTLHIQLRKKISSSEALELAKEIYEFCPDVIDQGSGSVEHYAEETLEANAIFLWWD